MENKLLPSGKIRIQKLLPSAKISAKKISSDSIRGASGFGISSEDLSFVKTKVILIRDLLKQQTLVRKEQAEKLRVQNEKKKFRKREKSLEKKSDEKEEKKSILQAPRIGFLERIKNFISKIILGYFTVKMVPFIPKLLQIVPKIVAVGDFIIDMSGKLLNGFVEFVDWGYKAHDGTKKFLKQIGGSGAEKAFDSFNGAVGKVLDAALIVALTMGDMGGGGGAPGPGGGRLGRGGKPNVVNKGFFNERTGRWQGSFTGRDGAYRTNEAARRYAQRFGRDAAVNRFGQEGVGSLGGKYARSGAENLARKGLVSLAGKGGAKAVLKFTRPLLKRLPIIGALIDFGLSVALGESPGRAAFKAIGAGLLGTIGAALGGPFAVLTGIAGGMLGDWAGGALYDVFFGNKNPSKKNVQGRAEGGSVTRDGRVQGSVKRKVKKSTSRRTLKPTTTKLKPGSAVGGKGKIENIFPETKDSGTVNPLGYIEKTYDTTSKIPFFGPIFDIAYKTIAGDKATRLDYRNASVGLNSWMNNTFNTEIMRMGVGAYAGGGEVNAEMFMKGEDLTNVIAKSLEDSISTKIDDAITELQKQLGLKSISKQAGVPGPSEPGPADLVNIQGGDADFWTLVAVASREDGEPQAWADVAQSIYNRLASGAYTGKSIKDLILGQMQYEPTWKFPRPGATGRPNQEWYAIKDAASAGAAAGQSEEAMKKVAAAILDQTLQKNAREFIQGRTDFRGYSVSGGVQRKAGDNYYGWYNNYKANKIGAVPNFGATATSTGGAGPSGGIFVGGGTGSGYGSGGVKIAGDLGYFMKSNRGKIGVTGSIHQHPRHPGQFRRGYFSYHNQNRALDIGGYGPSHPSSGGRDEQAPVIRALLEWNKKNGYQPVEIIHGSPAFRGLGKYESAPGALHSNHVHVAYAKGGLVDGVTYAMLGERGREFIIDADSTAAIENTFPGFLSALNKANYEGAISVLKNYAAYEFGSTQEVFVERPEPELIPVNMGGSSGSYAVHVGDSSSDDYAESLAMSQ